MRIVTAWQVSGKHVLMLQLSFFYLEALHRLQGSEVKHAQEENVNG